MVESVDAPAHDSAGRPVVLIVEDEFLLRWPAAEYLRESGYRIVEAASVDEAILAFSSIAVDLVFSDINLQGELNGHALARWVAANHPNVPMLLTSAEKSTAERASLGPQQWFIPKPYSLADVDARIQSILSPSA